MLKIRWRLVFNLILVCGLGIGLFLPIAIEKAIELKGLNYQPTQLREFASEKDKQKLYLFNQVGGNHRNFVLLEKIVELESSWQPNVKGDGGRAYGLAQFHKGTFDDFKKEAEMSGLEYKNPYHQLTLLVWAIDNGKQSHWTTYKRAKQLTKL